MLIANGKLCKLPQSRAAVAIDATNVVRHLFGQFAQKTVEFVRIPFNNHFHPPIGQILHKTAYSVPSGDRSSRIAESDALDVARVGYLPTLGHFYLAISFWIEAFATRYSFDASGQYNGNAARGLAPYRLDRQALIFYSPPAMKSFFSPKRLHIIIIMLLTSVVCPSYCLAWSLASQPVEGILVLRNGNILRGKLQLQGDQYYVHLPNGELRVREQQVEMVCQNIEEAYHRRREARVGSTADSHLELAGWCLRHDLFGHAEAELQDAQATDPKHPRLALLQRQLKHALKIEQRTKQQKIAAANPPTQPTPLDPAALDKAPKWARALFVRQIQPLVVHSCAAGGCHQSSNDSETQPGTDSKFHLNRLAIDGAGHPEATLRNLAALLEQIDWQTADQSTLLQRAQEAHGTHEAHGSLTASTPLPLHKLQVLQGWVEQLAEAHRKDTELRTLPTIVEIAALPATPTLRLNPPRQTIQQPPSKVRPASFETAAPVDPFDPSVFNRRYATVEKRAEKPNIEPSVPHVLAPNEPELILSPPTD